MREEENESEEGEMKVNRREFQRCERREEKGKS